MQTQDEDSLESARKRADHSLRAERAKSDASLSKASTAERELVRQERQETDKDLEHERSETDAGIRRSIVAFVSERESHNVTRASLATRDEFLAIVSHDLRNPLTSISMASLLLAKQPGLQGEESSKTRHFIDLIRRNAEEALRLISDLLDMENIAQGKLSLQLKPYDLRTIILQAMEMFEEAAIAKDISLQLDPTLVSAFSVCDRDRITQVLANLIGNAIKFTQEGGTVIVALNPLDHLFDISVTDDGPGIKPDMQQKIFERFFQIGKDDRRGLGLGLHISRMIVEAHCGRIWLDSGPGHGSKFHFTLLKA